MIDRCGMSVFQVEEYCLFIQYTLQTFPLIPALKGKAFVRINLSNLEKQNSLYCINALHILKGIQVKVFVCLVAKYRKCDCISK